MAECTGKTRYDSRDQAREALMRIQQDPTRALGHLRRSGYIPKRAYACPRCGGWHLTSQKTFVKKV